MFGLSTVEFVALCCTGGYAVNAACQALLTAYKIHKGIYSREMDFKREYLLADLYKDMSGLQAAVWSHSDKRATESNAQ